MAISNFSTFDRSQCHIIIIDTFHAETHFMPKLFQEKKITHTPLSHWVHTITKSGSGSIADCIHFINVLVMLSNDKIIYSTPEKIGISMKMLSEFVQQMFFERKLRP